MSSIPYTEQFFVEKHRNVEFEWAIFGIGLCLMTIHGALFHWIPRYLRLRRDKGGLKYVSYFKFISGWNSFNRGWGIKIWHTTYFFQPSILLLFTVHLAILALLTISRTKDLDYQPRMYIIGKRIGRVAMGNLPLLFLCIIKADMFCAISGLQHDRLVLFHKWLARLIWAFITIHMVLTMKYWLDLGFPIMIKIPPQIFGFIAYACLSLLTWASLKIIRRLAFDFFLAQHRVFNFIMLLLSFFHNGGNKAAVIVSVHALVIDRVVGRVIELVHKRRGGHKGLSEFEIIDDETMMVTIPVIATGQDADKWYYSFLPKVGTWKAGQHVYLNVSKVSFFQYHPFTISSLSNTHEIKLLIRKQKGFTRKLLLKLKKEQEKQEQEERENGNETESQIEPEITEDPVEKDGIVRLKAGFSGPYGGGYQPLITFDTALFIAAGSGASFTFPVAMDLLNKVQQRNQEKDFYNRPANQKIIIVWTIKKFNNMRWYSHVFDFLKPHIASGACQVIVYVTQSTPEEAAEYHNSHSDVVTTFTTNDDSSAGFEYGSSSKQHSRIGSDVGLMEKLSDEKVNTTEIVTGSSSIYSNNSIRYEYKRPDIPALIGAEALNLVTSGSNYKALAVVSCGPSAFSTMIKLECQKNRYLKGCPDIYCYNETF